MTAFSPGPPPNRTGTFRSIRRSSAQAEAGKGVRYHTDPYLLRAGKPAALRPGVLNPLWTAFPSADASGSSVPRGRSPRRPSRRASTPYVRA